MNLRSGRMRVLDHSLYQRIINASWSPDGRYVAYACSTTQRTYSIKLARSPAESFIPIMFGTSDSRATASTSNFTPPVIDGRKASGRRSRTTLWTGR